MDVNDCAVGPRVAFVDDVAVGVNLLRTIEMRAGFDRALAIVFNFSTPENGLPFFIGGLKFQPNVESVHGAAWKKVADFAGSNHDIDKIIITAAHGGLHAT